MFWAIPLIGTLVCAVVNPYIGLFALFPAVELLIYFCMDINVKMRVKLSFFQPEEETEQYRKHLKKSARRLANTWCVAAVVLCIICSIVCVGVWMLASGKLTGKAVIMLPVSIFPVAEEGVLSLILMLVAILLNVAATWLVFLRRKELLNADYRDSSSEVLLEAARNSTFDMQNIRFRVGKAPFCILAVSIIAGMCNSYLGWMSFVLHFWQLFLIGITHLIIASYRKAAGSTNSTLKHNARYLITSLKNGKNFALLFIAVGWLVTIIVIGMEIIMQFIAMDEVFGIISTGGNMVFLVLSCCCNLVFAVMYTKAVRNVVK